MKTLAEATKAWSDNRFEKAEYIEYSYDNFHRHLFQYASHLENTVISKITIENGRVFFTFKASGIAITCPPGDHRVAPIEAINFLDYEKDDAWMINRLVDEGDTIYDIGANIGFYSVLLASKYKQATVHCFEPIPNTYECCRLNIEINHLTNIICNNFGLSDKEGIFPFFFYPEGSGNASAVNVSGRSGVFEIQCQLDTLDAYSSRTQSTVDFIKCDVEGGEYLTFLGGEATISRDLPIVFSEILRKYCAKYDYDPNEIFNWFYGLGYQAFTARNNKLIPFSLMDERTTETNFFFLHSEKHSEHILDLCID